MSAENKKYTFSVNMTPKEVFRFSLHHSYFKLSGMIGVLLSVMALIMLLVNFAELGDQNKAVLLIVALWFTVLEPLTIYTRAKSQAKRNPVYKKPLTYTLDSEGITVSQDEQSQSINWNQLMKIVETRTQYLVYSNKVNAFIFPKASMKEQKNEIELFMIDCIRDTQVKVSSSLKRKLK
ncbi:MAG: YcxB family protein [Lachnospiraceae bacterium]